MLKRLATIFGVMFVAVGVLGFVPAVTPNGMLLGIFSVNDLHNAIHLASGAVALWVGFTSENVSRLYFKIFGVVYGAVTVLGLFYMDQPLLGLIAHNMADMALHFVIAAAALYLGFVRK
jgi:hypothetical protein